MSARKNSFPATSIPTVPVPNTTPTAKPSTENSANPLTSFFRKSRLSIGLPSRGQWYPANSLHFDAHGGLAVYAMTAADDVKLRAGDITLSGRNIFDVIRSCIPGIQQPESIPNIDIDIIMLAIRTASYGSDFEFTVSVPNTTLVRKIQINAEELLRAAANPNGSWQSELVIEDEGGQQLQVTVHPLPMSTLFATTKAIQTQRRTLSKTIDREDNIQDETIFHTSVDNMTNSAIELLCSGIRAIRLVNTNGETVLDINATNPQDSAQIMQIMKNLDVAYFNAIRDHIEQQRSKYSMRSPVQHSDAKELAAGAPETWTAELSFIGSNFLPEQKSQLTML